MADGEVKIGDLALAGDVTGSEILPVVQAGATCRTTIDQLLDYYDRRNQLAFNGDPGFGITPGDPIIAVAHDNPFFTHGGSTSYLLEVVSTDATGTTLRWTFPDLLIGTLTGKRFLLQRSPNSLSMPNGADTPITYADHHVGLPATDPDWTTIHDFGELLVNQYPKSPDTYKDTTPPNPAFSYRLVLVVGPVEENADGIYAEIDWNVVSVTGTYLLTGVLTGGRVNLDWGGAQGDPANALYNGGSFTVESSVSPGVWVMVRGPGGPLAALDGGARNIQNLDPANQFRVRGYLSNGLVVQHNIVTLQSAVPKPVIQRNMGVRDSYGNITPNGIAVDSVGNVIVVGQILYTVNMGNGDITSYGGQDCIIAKYSPSGQCLWSHHYGSVSDDLFTGVCVDGADNVYAIGSVSGPPFAGTQDFGFGTEASYGGADVLLVKFSASGAVLWHKLFGGNGKEAGFGVACDASNDVYIIGTYGFFGSGPNFGGGALPTPGGSNQHTFLVKLHGADGSHVWSKQLGASGGDTFGYEVKIGSDGHPVIVAKFTGNTNLGPGVVSAGSGSDVAIGKFNSASGATTWAKYITGDRDVSPFSISVYGTTVYVGGDFVGTAVFGGHSVVAALGGNIFLAQYDGSGNYVRVYSIGSEANAPHVASISADANGVVVSGEMTTGLDFGQGFLLGNGGNDVMLIKLASDLSDPWTTAMWSRRGEASGGGGDRAKSVTISGGYIYFAGDFGYAFPLSGLVRISGGGGQTTIDHPATLVQEQAGYKVAFWMKVSQ